MNGTDSILSMLTSPLLWLVVVILFTIKKGVHFVPQNRGYVIYTLGKYSGTLSAGLNFIIPFVQTVAADRNLKEQSLDIASQSAITKDNISLYYNNIHSWFLAMTHFEKGRAKWERKKHKGNPGLPG